MHSHFHHQTKRDQFARKIRQQQRNLIINIRRNCDQKQSLSPSSQKYCVYSQLCEFKFKDEILSYYSLCYRSYQQQQMLNEQISYKNPEIAHWSISCNNYPSQAIQILTDMIRYTSNLQSTLSRYQQQNSQTPQKLQNINIFINRIINQLLLLCIDCIFCNSYLKQSSACLSELAALKHPKIHITHKNPYFPYLMHCLHNKIIPIINKAANLQLTINCIYIMGNLHKLINSHQNTQKKIINGQLSYEMVIINSLLILCGKYPLYENCLLLMVWYLRNCVLIDMAEFSAQGDQQKYQMTIESENSQYQLQNSIVILFLRTVEIAKQLIVTATSYISQYFREQITETYNFSQTQDYLLKTIQETLSLLSLVTDCLPMLYSGSNLKQSHCNTAVTEKIVLDMLWNIDQTVTILISGHKFPMIINNPAICTNYPVICVNLIEICENVIDFTFMKNCIQISHQIGILPFIGNCAIMIVSSNQNSLPLINRCNKRYNIITKMLLHRRYMSTKIMDKIIISILENIDQSLKSLQAVENRQLRVSILKMIDQLLDTIDYREIRKHIQSTSYFNQNNHCKAQAVIEQLTLNFLSTKLIWPVFHILGLLLVDCQHTNIQLGLKMILKLVSNWELEKQVISRILIECKLDTIVIGLQDDRNEEIYDLAITVLDQLGISE